MVVRYNSLTTSCLYAVESTLGESSSSVNLIKETMGVVGVYTQKPSVLKKIQGVFALININTFLRSFNFKN